MLIIKLDGPRALLLPYFFKFKQWKILFFFFKRKGFIYKLARIFFLPPILVGEGSVVI